jgi:hypothetical protein
MKITKGQLRQIIREVVEDDDDDGSWSRGLDPNDMQFADMESDAAERRWQASQARSGLEGAIHSVLGRYLDDGMGDEDAAAQVLEDVTSYVKNILGL